MSTLVKVIVFILSNWPEVWELLKDLKDMWDNLTDDDKRSVRGEAASKERAKGSVVKKVAYKYQQRCP